MRRWPRSGVRACVVALAVVSAAGLSACSDDDDDGDALGEETSEVCVSRDEFEKSVDELRAIDPVEDGTDAFKDAARDVADEFRSLARAAQAEFGDDLDPVQVAVDDVRDAIEAFDEQDAASEALADVRAALTGLREAVADFHASLEPACEQTS
jgi:hypothetical protein